MLLRTIAALAGLAVTAPMDVAVAATAAVRRGDPPQTSRSATPRTILISGGKMTKALQLARSFHLAGHRVILAESAKYQFTGHRLSRAVDTFCCVPEPTDPDYAAALRKIVQREGVDVYVPVASPAASVPDADAREMLDDLCEVIHADAQTVRMLDDKSLFSEQAAGMGLRVPHWQRITHRSQIDDFDFAAGREYILKRLAYDPVGRMDLTRLRGDTPVENAAFARRLHISEDDPWILQEFIAGQEYCTHGTVRRGRLQVYGCCESSGFQVSYEMVDKPAILAWVTTFVEGLGVTGQLSFDFIESERDGHVYAIECNPRTHSAITMFHDHPDLAAAYLEDEHPMIVPLPTSRPTFWTYHEAWALATRSGRVPRLRRLGRGTDAVLAGWDPLPYVGLHHLQIPSLLFRNLRAGGSWSRIDFNIGKLVESGGD